MLYVLDTHVLIWYFIGSTRLKRAVKEKIEEIRSTGGRLLVPANDRTCESTDDCGEEEGCI